MSGIRIRWVAVAATFAIATGGCSGSNEPEPQGIKATELCAGTLDAAAAEALGRLADTDRFTEESGNVYTNQPKQFSLRWAAAHLHDHKVRLGLCGIRKAKPSQTYWAIDLDFNAAPIVPTREVLASRYPVAKFGQQTFFPLGVTAYTQGHGFATLYFKCGTRGNDEATQYVKADSITQGHLGSDSTAKDRMTIVNSVARHLAEELGCASEANLPGVTPDPETT